MGTLFLLVPEFFRVLLFRDIVEIAVIVHHPATVTAEGVFVPFSFGLLAPFLGVSLAEADTVLLVQADADCYRLVLHHKGQRFALAMTCVGTDMT